MFEYNEFLSLIKTDDVEAFDRIASVLTKKGKSEPLLQNVVPMPDALWVSTDAKPHPRIDLFLSTLGPDEYQDLIKRGRTRSNMLAPYDKAHFVPCPETAGDLGREAEGLISFLAERGVDTSPIYDPDDPPMTVDVTDEGERRRFIELDRLAAEHGAGIEVPRQPGGVMTNLEYGERVVRNLAKYRVPTWREWRARHWGPVDDIDDGCCRLDRDRLSIYMLTRFGAPVPAFKKLAKKAKAVLLFLYDDERMGIDTNFGVIDASGMLMVGYPSVDAGSDLAFQISAYVRDPHQRSIRWDAGAGRIVRAEDDPAAFERTPEIDIEATFPIKCLRLYCDGLERQAEIDRRYGIY